MQSIPRNKHHKGGFSLKVCCRNLKTEKKAWFK